MPFQCLILLKRKQLEVPRRIQTTKSARAEFAKMSTSFSIVNFPMILYICSAALPSDTTPPGLPPGMTRP